MTEPDLPESDRMALLEDFRRLSERHAAGEIEGDAYRTARSSLCEQLGIPDPDA